MFEEQQFKFIPRIFFILMNDDDEDHDQQDEIEIKKRHVGKGRKHGSQHAGQRSGQGRTDPIFQVEQAQHHESDRHTISPGQSEKF